jgi:alkylation response protein AidB-like acyl-CoA dehydrogenase
LQHSKFLLAEMAIELAAALAFTDRAITAPASEQLITHEASMAKRKSSPAT